MPDVRFTIGRAFPSNEPVARFVTVLAMISNDWTRSMTELLQIEDWHIDAEGRRVTLFRAQASMAFEAAEFISTARRLFPEVESFAAGLDERTRDALKAATATDSGWLKEHRNVTFHYPEMHPQKAAAGKEEITNALTAAADLEGVIVIDRNPLEIRFEFADQVAVQWLPEGEQRERISLLRQQVEALAFFTHHAIDAYLRRLAGGVVSAVD